MQTRCTCAALRLALEAAAPGVVNVDVPMGADRRGNKIFFIAEGRLFFDAPNGIDNNYQMWGGIRYVIGR